MCAARCPTFALCVPLWDIWRSNHFPVLLRICWRKSSGAGWAWVRKLLFRRNASGGCRERLRVARGDLLLCWWKEHRRRSWLRRENQRTRRGLRHDLRSASLAARVSQNYTQDQEHQRIPHVFLDKPLLVAREVTRFSKHTFEVSQHP